uniref:Uncharacterized protein n=1 Tax=Magallana gigas TaxID=29159 RepID=K1Q840_MAGGI
MFVGNSPKECLYDFADNSKLEEETQYNEENEELYHHLRESVPTNNVNDNTYMVAGYKTSDEDNVYFGRMEDPYDHLRGTDRTRQEDNTYDHAPIVGESDYSSFNIDVGRNTGNADPVLARVTVTVFLSFPRYTIAVFDRGMDCDRDDTATV